jgi:serine/threonine protein kinase
MSGSLVIGGQLGSYLIESVIGRGGMSVVYRATHSRLGTPVALKALAPELSSDDAFRERFLREAKMAAGIDHPNVIPIYDTGLHEDSLYIIMRFVSGGDLKTLLTTSGPLSLDRAIAFLTPVARALDAAHSHGLVHRDVKPANILIQRSPSGEVDHVYLSDFGVMKHTTSISGLTQTGALVGTIDYMAPEQIEGKDVSSQTDIYALGCLFYQAITGRVPHGRDSEAAALWAHMREDVEPASRVRPELPSAIDGVIARALAKNPAARFTTCEEFIRACNAAAAAPAERRPAAPADLGALAGATVAEPQPGPPPPGPPPPGPPAPPAFERPPDVTAPDREPAFAASSPSPPPPPAAAPPPAAPPAAAPPAPPAQPSARRRGGSGGRRRPGVGWLVAGLIVLVGGGIAAAVALTSGGSSSKKSTANTKSFPATLAGVPTNHVAGTGDAAVKLTGNSAAITVDTNGLLAAAPHAMHIHAGGQGRCPTAQAAQNHNGHLSISTVNGEPFYGPPVTSMTTSGDTSKKSILTFPRYPNVGNIRYTRTIALQASVAAQIRNRKASIIVHGIDYNSNGLYDSILDRSELDRRLPGEATAPALCGQLVPAKTSTADAGGQFYTASLAALPPGAGDMSGMAGMPGMDHHH